MKILIAVDTFHPKKDGVVRFLDEVVPRLGKSHEITVIAPAFKGKPGEIVRDRIKLVKLPISKRVHAVGYSSIKPSLENLRTIKKHVEEADVVVAQDIMLAGAASMIYGKRRGKRTMAFVHQISWEQFSTLAARSSALKRLFIKIIKLASRYLYRKCDLLIIPSENTEKILKKEGIEKEMRMVRLGIDIKKFRPPEDKAEAKRAARMPSERPVIGYCGRVTKEKNVEVLYEAFTRIKDKYKAKLLIVGGSKEAEWMKEDPDVIVTGFTDNVVKYLQAMDIFVMPSITETTSLATMEAMACGLPVLATPVGRIIDYVKKGYNGYIIPKNSVDVLESKLRELLERKELMEKMGHNARQTMLPYSWEKTAEEFEKVITSG